MVVINLPGEMQDLYSLASLSATNIWAEEDPQCCGAGSLRPPAHTESQSSAEAASGLLAGVGHSPALQSRDATCAPRPLSCDKQVSRHGHAEGAKSISGGEATVIQ